jgi:hypothetical protein
LFSLVLFAGTNNIIIILAKVSSVIKSELVSSKLKTSLNSIMEEEKSEKSEDIPDGKIIDILCDDVQNIHFSSAQLKSEYITGDDFIASIHHLPIFIPPPNI